MDIIPSEFTADEFEQHILEISEYDALEPDDPLYVELAQVSNKLSNLQTLISKQQRQIFPHLSNLKLTAQEIAEKVGCNVQTVYSARKNPTIRRMLGLVEHTHRLHSGPSQAQRLQMLWQIAKREQFDKPSISIKAVDTINKQVGDYSTGDSNTGGVVVNINEFVVGTVGEVPIEAGDNMTIDQTEAVEAVFTPITVEINDH